MTDPDGTDYAKVNVRAKHSGIGSPLAEAPSHTTGDAGPHRTVLIR